MYNCDHSHARRVPRTHPSPSGIVLIEDRDNADQVNRLERGNARFHRKEGEQAEEAVEQQEAAGVSLSKLGDEYVVRPDDLKISDGGYKVGDAVYGCSKVMVLGSLRRGLPITDENAGRMVFFLNPPCF